MQAEVHRLGWVYQQGKWHECRASAELPRVLLAGLHVAANSLHLDGVISFRIGRGCRKLDGIQAADDGLLLWWNPEATEASGPVEAKHLLHAPTSKLNLELIFGRSWGTTCFIQFVMVDTESVSKVREQW